MQLPPDQTALFRADYFLSVHEQVANLFRRPANINAADHRRARAQAFTTWANVTGIAAACRSDDPGQEDPYLSSLS